MDHILTHMLHVNELPDLILINIFDFIQQEELRLTIQLVCKKWQILSYDMSLWRQCSLGRTLLSDGSFRVLLDYVGHGIEVLDLDGIQGLTEQSLLAVAEHCPKLSEIKWMRMPVGDSSADVLREFVSMCPHLRRYDFSTIVNNYPSVLELCTGHLTSLSAVTDCNRFDHEAVEDDGREELLPAALVAIARRNPYIRHLRTNTLGHDTLLVQFCTDCSCIDTLSIEGATWTSAETLVAACRSLRCLTSLDISGTLVDDKCLCEVATLCPKLRDVHLSGCSKITDVGIIGLARNCHNITHITINNDQYVNGNITDVGLKDLASYLPGLRVLYISFCPSVTPLGVRHLAEKCSELEEIHMEGCVALTDSAFLAIALHCKELHTVNASQCLQLRSVAVEDMLRSLPKLETLHMESCRAVSELHLLHSKACSSSEEHVSVEINNDFNLKTNVSKMCNTDGIDLVTSLNSFDIMHKPSNLTHVSLNFCTQLKPAALCSLAMFCPKLRSINLTACCELTDSSLELLTGECKDLIHLDLASGSSFRFSKLTDKTLYSIARNCAKLQELHLKASFLVTMAGLSAVITNCSTLVVLSLTLSDQLPLGEVVRVINNHRGQCQIWDAMGRGVTGSMVVIHMQRINRTFAHC